MTRDEVTTAVPSATRGDRWLYRLLVLCWLACFALGCVFVLYAFEIQYRAPLIHAPNVTLGSEAYVLDHIVRMTAWGVVLLGFLHGLLPVRDADPTERYRAIGHRMRESAPRAALFLLALGLLGPVRDLADFDLFEHGFGEAFFRAPLALEDWLSGTTVGLAGVVAYLALSPSRRSSAASGAGDTTPPTAIAKWVSGALCLVVVFRILTWPSRYFAQDRHFEHVAVSSLTWELALAAGWIVADDPLRSWRRPVQWLDRNTEPLRLLAMLELLRVVTRQDWYYELSWLPTLLEHSPASLVFFQGRLHNLARLAVLMPPLALALGTLAWRFDRSLRTDPDA